MPAFDVGDVQMLHDIAERVSSTIANARLRFELAQRRRMLEMAVRQIEEVEEIERRRVALSIHDGLAQVATSVYQHLEAFASRYPAAESEAHDDLVRAQELARRTIREARRLIASMRPTVLDDFGLVPALLEEMGEMQAGGWEVRFSNDLGDERFPHRTELELFRVAQEALSNIRKHAGKTRVHIVLQHRDDALHLSVRDEGAGFDMEAVRRAGNSSEHVGLGGMRERIELLGGTIHIRSRPDEGTLLVVRVPLTAT
jgi:signal transduction histidine kinase